MILLSKQPVFKGAQKQQKRSEFFKGQKNLKMKTKKKIKRFQFEAPQKKKRRKRRKSKIHKNI